MQNLPRHFPNLLRQSKNSDYLAVTISKRNATLFIEGKGRNTYDSRRILVPVLDLHARIGQQRASQDSGKSKELLPQEIVIGQKCKRRVYHRL